MELTLGRSLMMKKQKEKLLTVCAWARGADRGEFFKEIIHDLFYLIILI